MSMIDEVVKLAGLALQAEDCALRAAVESRHEHGGLTRIRNERYYQFIVWRAALPKWHAEVERRTHDLILRIEQLEHVIEMKNWRGWGDGNWAEIQKDIDNLHQLRVQHGYVMVFSDNPSFVTQENFEFLRERLKGICWPQADYRFPTENPDGSPTEFWIAAWGCGAPL